MHSDDDENLKDLSQCWLGLLKQLSFKMSIFNLFAMLDSEEIK